MNPAQFVKTNGGNPAPAPKTSRMQLSSVQSGKIARALRVLIYGTEGCGKSTWASCAPSPIFLCSEDGTSQLDVARFPEPQEWSDAFDAVQTLLTDTHEYQTLVIDTLDWLEPLCWEEVCKANGWKNIEAPGFGKGYIAVVAQWRLLLARLGELRTKRNMNIILIAHSAQRTFSNPEGENFDRYEMKLHKNTAGVLKEWADTVLFASYEEFALKDNTKYAKAKGTSDGARIVRTERRAAFDAKNRHSLPFQMPLDWGEFWTAVETAQPASAARLVEEIQAVAAAHAGLAPKLEELLGRAGEDAEKLAKVLNWANAKTQGGQS